MTRASAMLALPSLSAMARRMIRAISRAHSLYRQRRALAALDARLLRDIGVTERDVDIECDRPLWDAPRHWRG